MIIPRLLLPRCAFFTFFWECQDQTIMVGLILDLPPGTSVARLSPATNDSSRLESRQSGNLEVRGNRSRASV